MPRILPYTVILWLSACAASFATDELFSRMRTETVFDSTGSPAPNGSTTSPEASQRFASLEKLQDGLRDSGLEPTLEKDNGISISLQHSKWTFPIRLEMTEQQQQIIILLAVEPADKKPLSAERLIGLLAANSQLRPAMFAFHPQRKRLELVVSLVNQNLTVRSLREEIRNLALLAEKTSLVWDSAAASAAPASPSNATGSTAAPPPPAKSGAAAAPAASSQLAGKWLGTRPTGESFNLQLNADGSFELAHSKSGRSTKSAGRFDFNGRQLTLTGSDGVKISGEVANIAAKSFDFAPSGAATAKLAFQRSN